MIISVEEAKLLVDVKDWSDDKVAFELRTIENAIRKYTNNNFQNRAFRVTADITGGYFNAPNDVLFKIGDTVEVSESRFNARLFTVVSVSDNQFSVEEETIDEAKVLVTKIVYPEDVIGCALKLLEWSINFGGKIGVKSETLSRHSVTYEDSATLFMGYPTGLMAGVKALHSKARF